MTPLFLESKFHVGFYTVVHMDLQKALKWGDNVIVPSAQLLKGDVRFEPLFSEGDPVLWQFDAGTDLCLDGLSALTAPLCPPAQEWRGDIIQPICFAK